MSDRLLTRVEAAEMFGLTENLIRTAARDRALAYVKVGRTFRFREDDVRAWVDSLHVPAQKQKTHTFKLTPRSAGSNVTTPGGAWLARKIDDPAAPSARK